MATGWQAITLARLSAALVGIGTVEPYGSSVRPDLLDGWSDLDVAIALNRPIEFGDLEPGLGQVWAWQNSPAVEGQTLRLVLIDGRRIDIKARITDAEIGSPITLPRAAPDNPVRFDAALAATRFGRGDRLIGLHLTLGVLRECLVVAMLLRDRAEGTDRHRTGSQLDARATEVARWAGLAGEAGSDLDVRPTVIEQVCRLYGEWRAELDAGYRADWSGLGAVIDRGTGQL
jgi:hypothetical protein